MVELRCDSGTAYSLGAIPDPVGIYYGDDAIRIMDQYGRAWLWPIGLDLLTELDESDTG